MAEDNYDLLPHKELKKIKADVDALKKGNIDAISGDLQASMNRLSIAIAKLIDVVVSARGELETDSNAVLSKKLDILIKHNETIANGTLELLELHREHLPRMSRPYRTQRPLRRPPPPPFMKNKPTKNSLLPLPDL